MSGLFEVIYIPPCSPVQSNAIVFCAATNACIICLWYNIFIMLNLI